MEQDKIVIYIGNLLKLNLNRVLEYRVARYWNNIPTIFKIMKEKLFNKEIKKMLLIN